MAARYAIIFKWLLALSCVCDSYAASAQEGVVERAEKADSVLQYQLDRLTLSDSLPDITAVDKGEIKEWNSLDSAFQATNHKIDSLQSLQLPTQPYQSKFDSIAQRLKEKITLQKQRDSLSARYKRSETGVAADSLQKAMKEKIDRLQQQIDQRMSFRDSLRVGTDPLGVSQLGYNPLVELDTQLPHQDVGLPQNGLGTNLDPNLPGLNNQLPGFEKPGMLTDAESKVDQVQQLPKEKLNEIGVSDDIAKVKGYVKQADDIADKVELYKEDVKEISEGNLEKTKALPQEVEKAALRIDEVKELQVQDQKLKASKNMLQQYQDMVKATYAKDATEKAKELAGKNITDPFAGKDEKLQDGVMQLDKLKRKYRSVPDSRYLPKRVPNEMKDKSFQERLVPGITFQFYKTTHAAIDFSPYLAYKLSGRFRPGLGATWRVGFVKNKPYMVSEEVYGFRVFNDFRWYGNFFLHTEGEWLHYSERALERYKFPIDQNRNEWQFRFNVGLFRTYRISNRLAGQVQLLYNVLDLKKFPQARHTSLRLGIEYKFKEKVKEQ